MSITTRVPANPFVTRVPEGVFNLNRCLFVTATVRTLNSVYLVTSRPSFGVRVMATDTNSPLIKAGEVMEGAYLEHMGSTVALMDADGRMVWRSSRIQSVEVHEN